jgi:hypothetical protein
MPKKKAYCTPSFSWAQFAAWVLSPTKTYFTGDKDWKGRPIIPGSIMVKEYCPEDEGKILGIWMPAPQI